MNLEDRIATLSAPEATAIKINRRQGANGDLQTLALVEAAEKRDAGLKHHRAAWVARMGAKFPHSTR